jgi:Protein of unknown function (DUF3501)
MRKVQRSDIIPLEQYDARRDEMRASAMKAKAARRIHLGPALTFLFENPDTVRYQVQEMARTERLFRPEEIQHELDTYNELLGAPGELGCSLLIEITDPVERDVKLRAWKDLPRHLYVKTADGRRAPARFDARQIGDDRLSSVQYLKFEVGAEAPVALGCDLPSLAIEAPLSPEQRAALATDLAG